MNYYQSNRRVSCDTIIIVLFSSVTMLTAVFGIACDTLCDCLDVDIGLLVDCSSKQLTSVPAGIPGDTVILKLSRNYIESVTEKDMQNLHSLKYLYLGHNQLRRDSIDERAFQNLVRLKNLDLSDNHLRLDTTHISSVLKPLTQLKLLDLANNDIDTIEPGIITVFDRLDTLVLTGNDLVCNCHLLWLKNWLLNTRYTPPIANAAECFQPADLRGQPVVKASFCPGEGTCYTCDDALSNEECNAVAVCSPSENACQNVIRTSNNIKRISKGCKQLEACLNNNDNNLDSCNEAGDGTCWYCCQGDLCNDPETAVVANGCRKFETPDKFSYQYVWPKIPDDITTFSFKLRTNNDGHIALAAESGSPVLVEIVLGGWNNQGSLLRPCSQCNPWTVSSTPNLLSPDEDRDFYVSFADGLIQVGIRGEMPFMSYQHIEELMIKNIGISTGWGNTGDWTFCGFEVSPTDTLPFSSIGYLEDGDIRLVGGSHPSEGRVEIFHEGKWGSICADSWDVISASVACRQLGYVGAIAAISPNNQRDGHYSSLARLDGVTCLGNETRLSECKYRGWGHYKCWHLQYANVVCATKYTKVGIPQKRIIRQATVGCPDGWDPDGEHCYYISTDADEYESAQDKCQEMGAMLASIHSQKEQNFLTIKLVTVRARLWIGLDDLDTENDFKWIDGTELNFEYWAVNQPDNKRGGEDCVQLLDGAYDTGEWNDVPCSNVYRYVCKKSTEPTGEQFTCAGKADGLYPDPVDCSNYYSCANNGQTQILTSCDTGLVFNPYCSCCDWAYNYDCQGVSDFTCNGREDGIYSDPDDCRAFFECYNSGGNLARRVCTEGTVFNPNCPCCDWPENYNCPNPINPVIYMGCYRDTDDRALPDNMLTSSTMTHELCFAHCLSGGFRYAGLQFSTQCFCGRDGVAFDIYGQRDDTECNQKCGGNDSQICGGVWRMNIYYLSPMQTPTDPSVTASVPTTTTKPQYCLAEVSNEGDKGLISWPDTHFGTTVPVDCPYQKSIGGIKIASRQCIWDGNEGARWEQANVDDCPTDTEVLQELADANITEDNIDEVSEMLAVVTSNPDSLNDDDLTNAVVTLEHISESIDTLTPGTGPGILTNVLGTVNHMADVPIGELERSQRTENTSSRILKTIDDFVLGVQFSSTSIIENTQAVDVAAVTIDNTNLDTDILFRTVGNNNDNYQPEIFLNAFNITDDDGLLQASVLLPNSLLRRVAEDLDRCQFVMFQDTTFFEVIDIGGLNNSEGSTCSPSTSDNSLQPTNCNDSDNNQENINEDSDLVTILNSVVISASVGDLEVTNLQEPATIRLRNINGDAFNPRCVYWDVTVKGGTGGWSQTGCKVNNEQSTKTVTVCECNHLTNFAMIMDVYKTGNGLPPGHTIALSVISYIGCAVSFVALLLTILTYTLCGRNKRRPKKKDNRSGRRDKRTKILLNLVVSLMLVNFFFICGSLVADNNGPAPLCIVMAMILHYLLLSAMIWMALEAFDMYMALVKVFESHYNHYVLKMCMFGWGLPIVAIAFTAGFDIHNYGYHNGICWLSRIPFYSAFLAPVCLILLFNSFVFVMVSRQLCQMRKRKISKSDNFNLAAQLKASLSITCLFGLTWILAIFAVGNADLIFSYMFAIVNSLQGFSLFFFHCVLNPDIRTRWYRTCCPKCATPEEAYPSNDGTSRRITAHQKTSTTSTTAPFTVADRVSQFESGAYSSGNSQQNSYNNDYTYEYPLPSEDYETINTLPSRTTRT